MADSLGVDDLPGAIIANLQKDGPAAKAGLQRGDVVTSVSGEPIKSATELTKTIHATKPGSSVQLAMVRAGKQSLVSATLDQLPHESEQPQPN
ncbi:PDZ domain-containing protein [Bradyrhizobium diazoefficiens]|nr:PDZ domain-containing protein [Bradyrhizobium diazoefficiens]